MVTFSPAITTLYFVSEALIFSGWILKFTFFILCGSEIANCLAEVLEMFMREGRSVPLKVCTYP
jgi:hypothetical protein